MRSNGSAASNRLDRSDYAIAAAAAAVILALRLLFLFSGPDRAWPHSAIYEGDAPVWARWAAALSSGQEFEFDLPFRTPGVAWLLHLVGLDSAPFTTAKILWCLMSAATGAALHLVVARWFTRRAGIIATVLFAISFGSFALATSLNNETPYALLLVCILGATLAWIERPRAAMAVALGALHAGALLLRAEHMLLVALLVAYAAWRMRGAGPARVASQCGLLVACMLACCAPWTLRGHAAAHRFNTEPRAEVPYASASPPWTDAAIAAMEALPAYARADNFAFLAEIGRRSGKASIDAPDVARFFNDDWKATPEAVPEWSLITMKGPLDFALANHPTSDGGFSRFGLGDAFGDTPPFSFARPSHARMLLHGYGIGLDSIRADPGRWTGLVGEKLLRFQDGVTVGLFVRDWPHTQYLVRRSVDVAVPLRWDAPLWSALVLALLAAGCVIAWRRDNGMVLLAVVGYKLAVTIAFYGYARQAVSISPVTLALTALALDAACTGLSRRIAIPTAAVSVARIAAGAAVLAAVAFAAYDAWSPPPLMVKSLQVNPAIESKPEWGEGAFETTDKLLFGPPAG